MYKRQGRHYRYDVVEKPGVGEFLAALKAEGAYLCVATAAPRELCRVALERLGIARYFDFVTDSYEVGMRKDCLLYTSSKPPDRPRGTGDSRWS